ncbi:hypothetical protein Scep_006966 [Stephania cephalantha]|uniref:Uncharacterized protein n=1 Tax=Stephania cephalantha TaxID=152367 RepID=A0AAP0PMR4_9MAGN
MQVHFFLSQLVESEFLLKQHDLHNSESKLSDRVHLVPSGLETVVHVKPQQYAMHCDALSNEIKLLLLSPERIAVYGDTNWRLSFSTALQNAAGMLVSEPFYYGNDGLPWQNLRFW